MGSYQHCIIKVEWDEVTKWL